jgi:hypothetical protein
MICPKGYIRVFHWLSPARMGGFYAEDFLAVFAATPDDVNATDVHTESASWLS